MIVISTGSLLIMMAVGYVGINTIVNQAKKILGKKVKKDDANNG